MSEQPAAPEEQAEILEPPETRIKEDVSTPVRPWVAPADPSQTPS